MHIYMTLLPHASLTWVHLNQVASLHAKDAPEMLKKEARMLNFLKVHAECLSTVRDALC